MSDSMHSLTWTQVRCSGLPDLKPQERSEEGVCRYDVVRETMEESSRGGGGVEGV